MNMDWLAELFGGIAIVLSVLIYQQKTQVRLLGYKAAADVLWILHYAMIGGYTRAAVTGVALIRETVFFCSNGQGKRSKPVLACFLCAGAICTVLTWTGWFSLFALAGSMLSVVSFWLGEPRTSRKLSIPISVCLCTYGLSNGSRAVLINELLMIGSSVLGYLRLDRKKG